MTRPQADWDAIAGRIQHLYGADAEVDYEPMEYVLHELSHAAALGYKQARDVSIRVYRRLEMMAPTEADANELCALAIERVAGNLVGYRIPLKVVLAMTDSFQLTVNHHNVRRDIIRLQRNREIRRHGRRVAAWVRKAVVSR